MQVASTTSSPVKPSSSSGSSDIAKLQKQLRELTEELKGVVSSDMDAKAKQEKAKLLQAQIQMVQAQITAIQRAQQQEQQLPLLHRCLLPRPVPTPSLTTPSTAWCRSTPPTRR